MNIEQTQAGVIGMAWDRGTSDAVLGRGYSNRYMHNGLKRRMPLALSLECYECRV